jgi:hypothetical protein
MISKMLIGCGAMAILLASAATCVAQTQEVGPDFFGRYPRPSTSIADIRKVLAIPLETKEFQEKMALSDLAKKLEKAISKKGKRIQVLNDYEDFRVDGGKVTRAFPFDSKFDAKTVLREVLYPVGEGKTRATIWVRSGQIIITSEERARSSYFVDKYDVGVNVKKRPLSDALDALAEQSGVSIIVDSRVAKKAQAKVTAKFDGRLETAVRLLTDSVGLKYVIVDNVIYVTSAANVDAFKEKTTIRLQDDPLRGVDIMNEMAYKSRPLLDAIGDVSGYVLDSRVKQKANIRVTAKWLNHVDADTAIRLLTDMAGLPHVVVDGVVYLTDATNAKKLMEEESRKKPAK